MGPLHVLTLRLQYTHTPQSFRCVQSFLNIHFKPRYMKLHGVLMYPLGVVAFAEPFTMHSTLVT